MGPGAVGERNFGERRNGSVPTAGKLGQGRVLKEFPCQKRELTTALHKSLCQRVPVL